MEGQKKESCILLSDKRELSVLLPIAFGGAGLSYIARRSKLS